MDIALCRAFVLGTRCSKSQIVPVPVVGATAGSVVFPLKDVRACVWMSAVVGNDWDSNIAPTWTETHIDASPFSVVVFTESRSSGYVNDLVWELSMGTCDWIGTILVLKKTDTGMITQLQPRDTRFVEEILFRCVNQTYP